MESAFEDKPKKRKKIIISSYDDTNNPFYAGGGAQTVAKIAEHLAAIFDVTMLTGNYRGAKNTTIRGVNYRRVGPLLGNPFVAQLVYSAILPFCVMREEYDLWIESFTPPFTTGFLPLFTKKRIVGFAQMLSAEDMKRKYKLPFDIPENLGLKLYTDIIALTENDKKHIENINPAAKVSVIPPGIGFIPSVNSFNKKAQANFILFMGRIEYNQKGLDLLIAAYSAIHTKTSKKLVIAGTGNPHDIKKLKETVKLFGLSKKVVMPGKVSGEEKDTLLRNCSVVAVPSRFETFSVAILEAMAYGKPVVAFDIKGLSWTPAGCVIKTHPFSTDSYAKNLLYAANDNKLRKKVFVIARKQSRDYLWEKVTTKHLALVRGFLNV